MPSKLPRRHGQRQSLGYHSKESPPPVSLYKEQQHHRVYEPRIKKKRLRQQSLIPSGGDNSNLDDDSCLDLDLDSGYNSESDYGSDDDTATFYRQKIDEFKEEGVTLSNPCDETKAMMKAEYENWELFCKVSKIKDARLALEECIAPRYKGYLFWRVKNSRMNKESSISTCWKVLSMVYARSAERYMDEGVLYDIRNWIPQRLTPLFGLDSSEKEKAGLFVEDLCTLQNGHWVRDTEVFAHEQQRVQFSLLLIFGGCTATRPKALVGKRPLLYKDIELQLFPPTIKGRPPIIVMRLNLNHIKRSGGKCKKKIFAFYEGEDLACCAVTFMMALALADNAFKNKFDSLKDIYNLVVPPDTDRLRLQWDDEWAERPVFRDVEHTSKGIRISTSKALQYPKHRHHFVRLGRTCGFEKRLEFYDLRRASGKRLNEQLTPEERRQIMGHRGDVYERYYMPAFIDVDCQAIYLGSTRRDDLIRAVGRLTRHEGAPKELTDVQKFEIWNDPKLIDLIQRRSRYTKQIKDRGYPTIKAAKGTRLYNGHKETQNDINTLKQRLSRELLEKTIKEFHQTIHTEEVNRQLQGIRPHDVLTPPTLKYEIKERATVAKLLFEPLNDLNEDQILQVRITLVQNLVHLCKLQESPHQYKPQRSRRCTSQMNDSQELLSSLSISNADSNDIVATIQQPCGADDSLVQLFCAFCRWSDHEAGLLKRNHLFSRRDSLGRHVRAQHLKPQASGEGFCCPYQGCTAFLGSAMHFLNHTARQHDLCL